VQDNAPYHSKKAIPGSSAKKQVVYDFIKKQIDENRYVKELPAVNTIRRFELDDMLEEITALPAMKNRIYKLDIKVAQKGNEILRLPPYHW